MLASASSRIALLAFTSPPSRPCRSWKASSPTPSPSGFSSLWFGPATYPPAEMEMWDRTALTRNGEGRNRTGDTTIFRPPRNDYVQPWPRGRGADESDPLRHLASLRSPSCRLLDDGLAAPSAAPRPISPPAGGDRAENLDSGLAAAIRSGTGGVELGIAEIDLIPGSQSQEVPAPDAATAVGRRDQVANPGVVERRLGANLPSASGDRRRPEGRVTAPHPSLPRVDRRGRP